MAHLAVPHLGSIIDGIHWRRTLVIKRASRKKGITSGCDSMISFCGERFDKGSNYVCKDQLFLLPSSRTAKMHCANSTRINLSTTTVSLYVTNISDCQKASTVTLLLNTFSSSCPLRKVGGSDLTSSNKFSGLQFGNSLIPVEVGQALLIWSCN